MEILEIAELFFIPSGLFLAALGSARTEPLKTAVSAIGLSMSGLWIWSVLGASESASTSFDRAVSWAPYLFAALWICSTVVHLRLWIKERDPVSRIAELQAQIDELRTRSAQDRNVARAA